MSEVSSALLSRYQGSATLTNHDHDVIEAKSLLVRRLAIDVDAVDVEGENVGYRDQLSSCARDDGEEDEDQDYRTSGLAE